MPTLVIADHDQGRLTPSTARIVGGASAFGPVDVLVVGSGVRAAADAATHLAGVARVRLADWPELADRVAEQLVPLIAGLAAPYSHIVAGAGAAGRDLVPRLAAALDLMPITDIVSILAPDRFVRPIYAGNALETVRSGQVKQLLTLRASAFKPAATGNEATIQTIASGWGPAAARLLAEHRTEGTRPDLSTAQIVVAGGVSLGSAGGFKLVEQLAERLGAAVGATRAAVDAGYAPNDWQIGQTGKVIAPDLYIALGISGALQHLAGIQGAKTIVAVNLDTEAPLMKLADIALVGDIFTVVPELITELDRIGG